MKIGKAGNRQEKRKRAKSKLQNYKKNEEEGCPRAGEVWGWREMRRVLKASMNSEMCNGCCDSEGAWGPACANRHHGERDSSLRPVSPLVEGNQLPRILRSAGFPVTTRIWGDVVSCTWEAEAGGFLSLRPAWSQSKFQDSQDYTEKPCLEKPKRKKKKKKKKKKRILVSSHSQHND
jgi:hypothetical protein